jgi:hypothetical protein
MPRDLIAERRLEQNNKNEAPRDLIAERGIVPKKQPSRQQQIWDMQEKLTPQEALVSRLMSHVAGWNKNFGDTAHGILQPGLESEWVRKHISPKIGDASRNTSRERNRIYESEKELNPLSAMSGIAVSQIAKAAPAALAGGLGLLPMVGSGTIGASIAGGLGGAAGGASQYVNPGESRALNTILGGGVGLLTGGLGGAGYQAPGAAKNVWNAYPAKKVAEKVISGKAATKAKYAKEYSDIFNQSGISHIRNPIKERNPRSRLSIHRPKLKPNDPEKYGKAYAEFERNPTPELAQKAQSDIGKLINKINPDSYSEIARVAELTKIKEGIIKDLTKSLEKKSPELAKRYTKAGQGYAKEYIPYKESKAIGQFEIGKLNKEELTDALVRDKSFRNSMKGEYPELITRKNLPRNLIGSGIGGTGLAYKYGLFDSLLGGNHD